MYYRLLLFAHVASVFAFLLVHGVSLAMAFRFGMSRTRSASRLCSNCRLGAIAGCRPP